MATRPSAHRVASQVARSGRRDGDAAKTTSGKKGGQHGHGAIKSSSPADGEYDDGLIISAPVRRRRDERYANLVEGYSRLAGSIHAHSAKRGYYHQFVGRLASHRR